MLSVCLHLRFQSLHVSLCLLPSLGPLSVGRMIVVALSSISHATAAIYGSSSIVLLVVVPLQCHWPWLAGTSTGTGHVTALFISRI